MFLQKKIGANTPSNYVNLSVDGETTSGLLWRLESYPQNNFKGYDAVIISSGGNDLIDSLLPSFLSILSELSGASYKNADLLKKINLASERFFASAKTIGEGVGNNLSAVLSKLKEQNPNAFLGVLSIYDPFDDNESSSIIKLLDLSLISPCIKLLNTYIKKAAEENGFEYIDITELFKGKANEFTNIKNLDIHPNLKGHASIGEELAARYTSFKSKSVFFSSDIFTKKNSFVNTVLGVASIAGATLFGCCAIVISPGKNKIKLTVKQ